MNSTSSVTHEKISQHAHQIWEQAGRPDGRDTEHWLQAERELNDQQRKNDGPNNSGGRSVEPSPGTKHDLKKPPHSSDYAHPGVSTDSLHHFRKR